MFINGRTIFKSAHLYDCGIMSLPTLTSYSPSLGALRSALLAPSFLGQSESTEFSGSQASLAEGF